MAYKRYDIYIGRGELSHKETGNLPMALIVSPDEINNYIDRVLIAPLIPKGPTYPTRVECRFRGEEKQIVLDQLQTVKKAQLARKVGRIPAPTQSKVLSVLNELFAK